MTANPSPFIGLWYHRATVVLTLGLGVLLGVGYERLESRETTAAPVNPCVVAGTVYGPSYIAGEMQPMAVGVHLPMAVDSAAGPVKVQDVDVAAVEGAADAVRN